jgi:hypothetical protein
VSESLGLVLKLAFLHSNILKIYGQQILKQAENETYRLSQQIRHPRLIFREAL